MKFCYVLALLFLLPLAACGHKGDVKRPHDIKAAEEKAARRAAERGQ